MPILSSLDSRHPEYARPLWMTIDAFADGGMTLLAAALCPDESDLIVPVLYFRKNETKKGYIRRVDRASTVGFMGAIISQFGVSTLSDPPKPRISEGVGEEEFYTGFISDVDKRGTDLAEYLRADLNKAMRLQKTYTLVEFPITPEDSEVTNRAQADALDLNRAYLISIPREQITDWDRDAFGRMIWARISTTEEIRNPLTGDRDMVREEWREIFLDRVDVYSITYEHGKRPGPEINVPLSGTFESRTPGTFPLVELDIGRDLWLGNQLLPPERALINLISNALYTASISAFPTLVINKKDVDSAGCGKPKIVNEDEVLLLETDEDAKWIESTGAAIDSILGMAQHQREEMYRAVRQLYAAATMSPAGQQQSGDAKSRDFAPTVAVCKALGKSLREYTKKILDVIAAGRNETVEFDMAGMSEFDPNAIRLLLDMIADLGSPTAKAELAKKLSRTALPDAGHKILEIIEAEIDKKKDAPKPVPPVAPLAAPAPEEDPEETPDDKKEVE